MRSAVFMELNNYAVCEREWAVLLSYVAAVTWVIDRDFCVVSIKSIIMLDCFDTTFCQSGHVAILPFPAHHRLRV